jgi:tyrosyl-tRNA synthetase
MSKSLDNYVGIAEAPDMQLGKLMSISDALMWRYYTLLSAQSSATIAERKAACESGAMNPRDAKLLLAKEIVARYHTSADADEAERKWLAQFSKREVPEDLPEVELTTEGAGVQLAKALADAGLVPSNSEGRRRIKAGAVTVDGEKVSDEVAELKKGARYVVKAGKRAWAAITVR